jgi:protein-tyrosine-phosphatase
MSVNRFGHVLHCEQGRYRLIVAIWRRPAAIFQQAFSSMTKPSVLFICIAMHAHCARQVRASDFERFDWIVGMTAHHCAALRRLAPAGAAHKVHMLTEFAEADEGDVPDPWYGGQQAFVEAFDLIERGVDGLLAQLVEPPTSAPARPPTR